MLLPAADTRPPADRKRVRTPSFQFRAERRLIRMLARTGAVSVLLVMICLLGYRAARHLISAALARPHG